MNKIINLISVALREHRMLTSLEITTIVEELVKYYQVNEFVRDFELDYNRKNDKIAAFNPLDNTLYFNMMVISEKIVSSYDRTNKIFKFNEYHILQQLIVILHEVRHAIQKKMRCDVNDSSLITEVIRDSDITFINIALYNEFYHLFPVEKDAVVFSCNEVTQLFNLVQFFDDETIRVLYDNYIKQLLVGYNIKETMTSTLGDFYLHVIGDYNRYLELQQLSSSLTTYDKMSYNFTINNTDLRNLHLADRLIRQGFNPDNVLKKKFK